MQEDILNSPQKLNLFLNLAQNLLNDFCLLSEKFAAFFDFLSLKKEIL